MGNGTYSHVPPGSVILCAPDTPYAIIFPTPPCPSPAAQVMYNVTLTLPGFVEYDPTKSTAPPPSLPDCDAEQLRLLWEMPPTDLNITVTL